MKLCIILPSIIFHFLQNSLVFLKYLKRHLKDLIGFQMQTTHSQYSNMIQYILTTKLVIFGKLSVLPAYILHTLYRRLPSHISRDYDPYMLKLPVTILFQVILVIICRNLIKTLLWICYLVWQNGSPFCYPRLQLDKVINSSEFRFSILLKYYIWRNFVIAY